MYYHFFFTKKKQKEKRIILSRLRILNLFIIIYPKNKIEQPAILLQESSGMGWL